MKTLVAIPVHNEVRHIIQVLDEVRKYADDILAVNDGSSDGSGDLLNQQKDLHLIHHHRNTATGLPRDPPLAMPKPMLTMSW